MLETQRALLSLCMTIHTDVLACGASLEEELIPTYRQKREETKIVR